MTKPTPTPWKIRDGWADTVQPCDASLNNEFIIATLYGPDRAANARLIVRAVNAHEALVEALDHAVNIIREHVPEDALGIDGEGNFEEPGGHLTRCWPVLDEHLHYMDAALALAKGDPE